MEGNDFGMSATASLLLSPVGPVLVELREDLLAHGEELIDVEHVLGVVLLDEVAEHVKLVAEALRRVPDDAVIPSSSRRYNNLDLELEL